MFQKGLVGLRDVIFKYSGTSDAKWISPHLNGICEMIRGGLIDYKGNSVAGEEDIVHLQWLV